MISKETLHKLKLGKQMVMGLRSATTSEIDAIKKHLREHNIPFKHKIEGLRYNGVIHCN